MVQVAEPHRRLTRRDFTARLAAVSTCGFSSVQGTAVTRQTRPAAGAAGRAVIEDLVAANRILAQQGIVDGFGHVSARHDRDPGRFFLSRSLAPELVTADDILEYDLESRTVDPRGPGYLERFIHGDIYKARPDVKAIVHSHSPALIPFGVTGVALRPVYHMAAFIGDGVPIFDIGKAIGVTDMLVSEHVRGRALADVLGPQPAALMRGHGVVVVGPSVPIAIGRSIYLELNARLQLQALGLGGTMTYLSPDEAHQVMAAGENGGYSRAWELWKRKAMPK